jgi:uncharacterized membrane protein YdfJ with MMPL/SSD domain
MQRSSVTSSRLPIQGLAPPPGQIPTEGAGGGLIVRLLRKPGIERFEGSSKALTLAGRRSAWGVIGRRIARRPRPVWIGSTLALGILALGGLGIKTGLDEENVVTSTPESLAGQQVLVEHYPAGQGRPVQVITNAPAADDVTAAIQQVEGVAEVVPGERSTDGQLVSVDVVLADPSDSPAAEASTTGRRSFHSCSRWCSPGCCCCYVQLSRRYC